jgi:riboflavin transporter FmnP
MPSGLGAIPNRWSKPTSEHELADPVESRGRRLQSGWKKVVLPHIFFPNGGKGMKMTKTTKNLVTISMLMAFAFVGYAIQITSPFAPFLKFDLSEFFCILGAMIFGPLIGVLIVFVKVLLHFIFIDPEPIGHAMNFIAVSTMVATISLIFRPFKETSRKWLWLVLAIVAGVIARALVMIPANFIAMKFWWGSFFPNAGDAMIYVYASSIPFNITQGILSGTLTGPLYEAYERWLKGN